MKLADLHQILDEPPSAWRIHFEVWHNRQFKRHEMCPAGDEEPLRSQGEAEALALRLESVSPRYRNVRVEQDRVPERGDGAGRVFAYCRVSTDHQDVECGVQKDAITEYVDRVLKPRGLDWSGKFFVDPNVSGGTSFSSRPAGFELNCQLRSGDHIVLHKLDRGFRSLRDFCRMLDGWIKREITLHVLNCQVDTSTVMGRFVAKLLAGLAEMERELITERTRESAARRRRLGKPLNQHAPIGHKWKNGGKFRYLAQDDVELKIMRHCYQLRLDGMSYPQIARELLRQGIEYRPGHEWSHKRVERGIRQLKTLVQKGLVSPG